jgi:predicted Zn-dependent protease
MMDDPQEILANAKAAVERGDKDAARVLLDDLIFRDADNEHAWLLLSEVVTDSNEVKDCLRQVHRINPSNPSEKMAAVVLADRKAADKEREKIKQRQQAKEARAKRRKEQAAEKKKHK